MCVVGILILVGPKNDGVGSLETYGSGPCVIRHKIER